MASARPSSRVTRSRTGAESSKVTTFSGSPVRLSSPRKAGPITLTSARTSARAATVRAATGRRPRPGPVGGKLFTSSLLKGAQRTGQPLDMAGHLLGGSPAHHEPVVLHDHGPRALLTRAAGEGPQLVLQGLGQSEAGVHQVDPDHVLTEVLQDQASPFPAATELVDQGGVEVDHEPARHQVVQDGLDRWALAALGVQARRQHRLL